MQPTHLLVNMKYLGFYRIQTINDHCWLGRHFDDSGDYNRAIKETRHDIDIARIKLFQAKQQADTKMAEFTWKQEDLEAKLRAAEGKSEDYKSHIRFLIELRECASVSLKANIDGFGLMN